MNCFLKRLAPKATSQTFKVTHLHSRETRCFLLAFVAVVGLSMLEWSFHICICMCLLFLFLPNASFCILFVYLVCLYLSAFNKDSLLLKIPRWPWWHFTTWRRDKERLYNHPKPLDPISFSLSNELNSKLCQAKAAKTKFQKVGMRFLQLESKCQAHPSSASRPPWSPLLEGDHSLWFQSIVQLGVLMHCIVSNFRNWGIEELVNACPQLAMIIDLTHTDRFSCFSLSDWTTLLIR